MDDISLHPGKEGPILLKPVNFILIEVIERAQKGDNEAMLILLNQFDPLLNKYAKKLALDYEDAKQEVTLAFIELIQNWKLSSLKDHSNGVIVAYIARSVYHSYIYISQKSKLSIVETSMADIALSQEHMEKYAAIDNYTTLYIEEIATVLSKKEALVFLLHYLQDIPIELIAKFLGISRQAANKTKNKAIEKLKKFYREDELL